MNAADVMVHQVITIGPDATIRDVAALLVSKHISAVPVTDADGKLLGIISEGDLLRRSENDTERRRSWWLKWLVSHETLTTEFIQSHSRRVGDLMTRNVIFAQPDTLRWSRFLRQAAKVDLQTERMIHHEDTQTVHG